jgi:hypothetical protein
MKPLTLSVILLLITISCSAPKTESTQNDTTSVATDTMAVAEEDGDMSGGSIMFQSQKNELDAFVVEFNGLKDGSNKIIFDASYDLGGFTRTCHFVNGQFLFFHNYESGEGGYEETTLMRMQPGKESVVHTGSETKGFFKLVDNGSTEWFRAVMNNESNAPTIEDFCEPVEYGTESLLKEMIAKIIENKDKFTLVDGRYEWYMRKEKTTSEYGGDVEVHEVFRIDPKLFDLDFNTIINRN